MPVKLAHLQCLLTKSQVSYLFRLGRTVIGAKKCYDMDMLNNLRLIVNCLVEESPNQYTPLCAQRSVFP